MPDEKARRKKNRYPGVFKRGAKWYYKLSVQDASGKFKQVWRGGFDTQEEAHDASIEARQRKNTGIDINPKRLTVEHYLKTWLRNYAKQKRDGTYTRYENLLRVHVIPVIGHILLSKLLPAHIQGVYSAMREPKVVPAAPTPLSKLNRPELLKLAELHRVKLPANPQRMQVYRALQDAGVSSTAAVAKARTRTKPASSEKTILNAHRVLSEALKHSVQWEQAIRNPAEKVKPPTPDEYEPEVFSFEVIMALIGLLDENDEGHEFVHFALYSGMRQGEQRRLKWPQVNLQRSELYIPHAKSKSGRRALTLSEDCVKMLKAHRMRQMAARSAALGANYKDEGYVFAHPDGSPLTESNIRWTWKKLMRRLALKARPHDLRHTNASLLLFAGVPMKVVQERLGHASYQITADIYSHLTPGLRLEQDAAARFDAVLRGEAANIGTPDAAEVWDSA